MAYRLPVRQLEAESKLLSENAMRANQDEQEAKYLQEDLAKEITSLEAHEREIKRQRRELVGKKDVLIDNRTQTDLDCKETKEKFHRNEKAFEEAQGHLKRLERDIGNSRSALDEVSHL